MSRAKFYREYKQFLKDTNQTAPASLLKWNQKGSTAQYWQKQLLLLKISLKPFLKQIRSPFLKQIKNKEWKNDFLLKKIYRKGLYNFGVYMRVSKDTKIYIIKVELTKTINYNELEEITTQILLKYGLRPDSIYIDDIDKLNNKQIENIKNSDSVYNTYYDIREHEKLKDMYLFDIKYFKLNKDISSNYDKINVSCVQHALKETFKDYHKKAIKQAQNIKIWNVQTFIKFLNDHKINYDLYFKNFERYDKKTFDKKKIILFGLLKNEHIYLMNKKEINILKYESKTHEEIKNIVYDEDLYKIVLKNIENDPIKYISIDRKYNKEKDDIINYFSRFAIKDTLYTIDKKLNDSYELYKQINIDIHLTTNYKIYTPLLNILQVNKFESHFIEFLDQPQPVLYDDGTGADFCIDKNRAYLYALSSLPNLPIINGDTQILKYNNEINKEYFYNISNVKNDKYGVYRVGWCSGYRIIDFKDVEIKEIIKPTLIKNPLKNILLEMDNINPDLSKKIAQIFVGVLQSKNNNKIYYNEILKTAHGYEENEILKIGDLYTSYNIQETNKKYINSPFLPVAHFVIDHNIKIIFDKIKILQDKGCTITRIKTDSIAGRGDYGEYDETRTKKQTLDGWKDEELGFFMKRRNTATNKPEKTYKEFDKVYLNKSILFNCAAGAGKTHFNINKLLPNLDKDKTLIISSTHNALQEYYNIDGLNVSTIQHYTSNAPTYNKDFNKYKYIIIDECGLLDHTAYYYISNNINKDAILYGFGDSTQLNPVGLDHQPLKNPLIYRHFFDGFITLNNNWRNNFTKKCYEEMKQGTYKITSKINKLINKITDNMICYTNSKKEELNKKRVKKLKYNDVWGIRHITLNGSKTAHEPFIIGKGLKIVSINNNLSKKGILNNTYFNIIDYDNNNIKLQGFNKIYTLNKDEFNNNFDYGYASTLYRIQGRSIDINNISFFEFDYIKKDGTKLYTCLSRIKEKLKNKPDEYNIIIGNEEKKETIINNSKFIILW